VNVALVACFASSIAFGLLACVSKVAEKERCNAPAVVFSLMAWSAVFMLLRTVTLRSGFDIPLKAVIAAVGFGIASAAGYFSFQKSMELGKVTVGWLMMNLSAGVPAIVSIWMYRETVSILKLVSFTLALAAIVLLFQGRMIEQRMAGKDRGGE
jgi:drug/metabolite transporter (DMT)-like permease